MSSNVYKNQKICPDCGGDLVEQEDGSLICQDCEEEFFVDDDGSLYTVRYDPEIDE